MTLKTVSSKQMAFSLGQKYLTNFRIGSYCRQFLKEQMLDASQVERIQISRLKRVCIAAYENHPFYRERFERSRLDPYSIKRLEQIRVLPTLSKEEYRQFTHSITCKNTKQFMKWYKDGTSGSTGKPLQIFRTWNERAYMVAKWMRALYRNGYNCRDKTFSLPSPHRLQSDSIFQKIGIMRRHSVPYTAPVERMVNEYLEVEPTVLYGNKSQLVMMAVFSLNKGMSLPPPRLCVSAAETMDNASKRLIKRAFQPTIFIEVYGAVEFNNLAWQEADSESYNFSHTTNLLELESDGHPADSQGKCIITDFFIDSFPLIRYELGDQIEISERRDGQTVITKIKGRADDWIVFTDGTRSPFHLFYEIMERRPEVRQFRIIQETHNLIRVLVVKEDGTDSVNLERILLNDLQREVRAEGVTYSIEWSDEIPPDPNGKLRMVISKVRVND